MLGCEKLLAKQGLVLQILIALTEFQLIFWLLRFGLRFNCDTPPPRCRPMALCCQTPPMNTRRQWDILMLTLLYGGSDELSVGLIFLVIIIFIIAIIRIIIKRLVLEEITGLS